jgi:drug/metabolite transporter (DMT)-like permease
MALGIETNALVALAAAASWGGGDFSGGMGVKASGTSLASALRFVIVAYAISLVVVLGVVLLRHDPWPVNALHNPLVGWGVAGGVAAGFSLVAFYIALSRGAMGASAAVSGLLAAAIPAVVSTAMEGAPTVLRIAGFALAAAAIWMIAAGPAPADAKPGTMWLAIAGGLGFGFYFVALRMDNPLGVLEPLVLSRAASLLTCLVLLAVLRKGAKGPWLSRGAMGWAMGVAVLDTGGNLLFLTATRMGRLDVAAVLASLYPAGTILLAGWRLHERPTRRQVAGMVVALAAVVMITV